MIQTMQERKRPSLCSHLECVTIERGKKIKKKGKFYLQKKEMLRGADPKIFYLEEDSI